ncbi:MULTISPECIES: CCA tRNA nucleotidyltransferase [unclassified Beijerinckia]|uniref:CCA tRNA nucleotidyltransferase n=1 Tax=unclassified Beijerinckia TaxID=2638183 RepID=UPI00089670D8|nr:MULTISPECIES: CCA tRNA nucleotidyltransferase [unclassified Beijerinckia]MDH7794196.1 poly(A) polymerase [Beijerinckia sp. GAS462]SEB55503.1 poly(A) polymerase [Beijerinckia sp. 28-YEA-48]
MSADHASTNHANAKPAALIVNGRIEGAAFLNDPKLQHLLNILNGDGEETRVVGGAVRNALMGEPVHELDLATTALPTVVQERCHAARLRTIPTGIEHGTVTVLIEGTTFEVTTLREDIATDGRHAVVRFGRDFRADALRRDFTINALSVDAAGKLHDYTDGVSDIGARHVRFIGVARQRIREDYLRILRLFRFHAAYGEGPPDREAMAAAIAERHGLERLSRERIQAEILKLLLTRRAADVVAEMTQAGIFGALVAGVVNATPLARFIAIEQLHDLPGDATLRLAAACVLIAEDAARLRDRLRLSNQQETRLSQAAAASTALHGRLAPPPHNELGAFLYVHGRRAALDGLMLAQAASPAPADDSAWRSALHFLRDTPEIRLPVSGADILARGIDAGPAIGVTLKHLQARWIRAGFPQDPETLARLIDESIADSRR